MKKSKRRALAISTAIVPGLSLTTIPSAKADIGWEVYNNGEYSIMWNDTTGEYEVLENHNNPTSFSSTISVKNVTSVESSIVSKGPSSATFIAAMVGMAFLSLTLRKLVRSKKERQLPKEDESNNIKDENIKKF